MDDLTILNYPGSKKKLLDYIFDNTKQYIDDGKVFLDIFSGTGVVASYFKKKGFKVVANDVEIYSFHVCNALLNGFDYCNFDEESFFKAYSHNKEMLLADFGSYIKTEDVLLKSYSGDLWRIFYGMLPKIWALPNNFKLCGYSIKNEQDLNTHINDIPFALFTLYYSGSYFSLRQSIEIDSLRYAIEKTYNESNKSVLLACLYFAIKETAFSKDGHMAQPLDKEKYFKRYLKLQEKNILDLFEKKLTAYKNTKPINDYSEVKNESFLDLINNVDSLKNVGLIYADPPYTDMQYSRYFHLLTTITNYEYPKMTYKNGKLTTGLYAENRFQSTISKHTEALIDLTKLISKASSIGIPLVFSYAFPEDRDKQPIDRYTMDIDDLIKKMEEYYSHVEVQKKEFKHCNNRNSSKKSVYEYLIIGVPNYKKKRIIHTYQYELFSNNEKTSLSFLKERLSTIKATNRSSIYNTMLYWAQKPYNITDELIDSLSDIDDIVMDPFMGSGVTILEASNNYYRRKSIGVEINDLPIFLCKQSINIPSKETIRILQRFIDTLEEYMDIYSTNNEIVGSNESIITKTVFDIKPNFTIKEIFYKTNVSEKIFVKKPSAEDYQRFNIQYEIKNIENISLIENSRIAVKKGQKIADLFTNRNLHALDLLKGLIRKESDIEAKKILTYIYASIIHKSKILDVKLSSQWPLWVPNKNCVERNVFMVFIESLKKYIISRSDVSMIYGNSFVESFSELKNGSSLIIQKGIQNVAKFEIPSESVGLVITDPPYLDQVPYSEYMQLYKPFLDNYINFEDEIVITNAKTRNKTYELYFSMMEQAFSNISRMLKWGGYVCMYFHDSDLTVWRDLIKILQKSNIVFDSCIHIDKSKKTLKKILDPKKTMSGETLLFFVKDYKKILERDFLREDYDYITQMAKSIIINSPNYYVTTSQLYDNGIMSYIIKAGILSSISTVYKDLTELFGSVLNYNSELGMWTTRDVSDRLSQP